MSKQFYSKALGKCWVAAVGSRPLSPEQTETLYQITEGRACYGVVVKAGVVIDCAPYGRKRWIGKTEAEVVAAVGSRELSAEEER